MARQRISKAKFSQPPDWKSVLRERLPRFGHRNWIVVADSAYPAQSNPGIETLFTGADQLTVVRDVLDMIHEAGHVRPDILLDAELSALGDHAAAGAAVYRKNLARILADLPVESLPHEEIIVRLDEAAKRFKMLVLKTTLAIPYTSVFVRLECGYWNEAAERRLRATLA